MKQRGLVQNFLQQCLQGLRVLGRYNPTVFAMLDVFATEPLAPDHPFWHHPRLILTPHVAADTILEEAVRQIAARLRALSSGQPVNGLVDRQRGY